MLKAHRWVFAGMVVALCSPPVVAEDLLQVYRQALDSDPVLKAAVASQQASQESIPQARALFLPTVGASGKQGRSSGTVDASATSPSRDFSFNTSNYAVTLNQPVYNRGSLVQQRLAESTVKQADVKLLNTQSELILRTAKGYFTVLAAMDSLTFATAEKDAFARQLEQANRRFEVGLATITDVYDAQARFDGAVSSEIDAINTLANAREQLRQLTGIEYPKLSILSERMPLTLPDPNDPEVWVNKAMTENLALRSANFDVDQSRQNIQLQKAGHYPTLDVSASSALVNDGSVDTTMNQVNVQLAIPLYSGGAVSSRSRQAAYNYEAARQNLENLQRDTIRTVRNAYRGQETAISQVKALDRTRVSTRSALEATQAGYEVGTRTIVDVLNAERDVYRAERDYASARYSYVVNFLTLRQSAGQLTESDVTEINGWLSEAMQTSGTTSTATPGSGSMITAKPIGLEDLRPTPLRNRTDKPDKRKGSGEESSASKPVPEKQEKHKLSGDQ